MSDDPTAHLPPAPPTADEPTLIEHRPVAASGSGLLTGTITKRAAATLGALTLVLGLLLGGLATAAFTNNGGAHHGFAQAHRFGPGFGHPGRWARFLARRRLRRGLHPWPGRAHGHCPAHLKAQPRARAQRRFQAGQCPPGPGKNRTVTPPSPTASTTTG